MIIATSVEGVTYYSSIDFPHNLALHVFIPDYKLNTAYARKVLPASYTRAQCIHNISRVSLLIHALLTENYAHLKLALSDEIHEPFRYPLIEDSTLIKEQLAAHDTLGHFISGAGPTLITLTKRSAPLELSLNTEHFKHHWNHITVEINKSGAIYEIIEEIT
jgi:homoserine kinase